MNDLRRSIDRFFFRNRDKGIPNLMLYIAIGNAIVTVLGLFNGGNILFSLLYFDKGLIMQGQVWRLFTYAFTQYDSSPFSLLFLYFFYMLGRNVEQRIGTLKFNLFYLSGILLMDVFAMIFSPVAPGYIFAPYANMSFYLHLSLLLAFATLYPDARFLLLMIIPIPGWVFALVYLIMIASEMSYYVFPHCLLPLVAISNYLLFMGGDIGNLFPFLRRRKKPVPKASGPIPFTPKAKPQPQDFSHRCRICGRTDVTNPELEFRYCSRCSGYQCYCQDHINNHTHVE